MSDEHRSSSRVLAYLQLMRLPNVFTAMADVVMGYWFTHWKYVQVWELMCVLVTSGALYTAGMVLNDVFDREVDSRERPQRPIPSGRVRVTAAVWLGIALFVVGIGSALAIGILAHRWGPSSIALALMVLIVSYDGYFKHTAGGPLAMGICRMLNVLLGMSISPAPPSTANSVIACGIGLYTAGLTWFAAREASGSRRGHLFFAFLIMLAGMVLLFSYPWQISSVENILRWFLPPYWIALGVCVVLIVGWRFVRAIAHPYPEVVQAAVKHGILSIVLLDAAVLFPMRGPLASVLLLLLLVPAVVLGRWVYST